MIARIREASSYWDQEISKARAGPNDALWYRYMAEIHGGLIAPAMRGPSLKTDLFEEARGIGPFDRLPGPRFGVDESPEVVAAARAGLAGQGVAGDLTVADVRRLPFASGAFGFILSGSTLDHFQDRSDLHASLRELARVLAVGGTLVLTLDNPHNPVLKVRSRVPRLSGLRLQPYFVGETLTLEEGEAALRDVGLTVRRARPVAHAPRDPVMRSARFFARHPRLRWEGPLMRALLRLEALGRTPMRWRTGYYLAFEATKDGRDVAADEPARGPSAEPLAPPPHPRPEAVAS